MSVRVLRQLSSAFASMGAALREAADDLEKEVTGAAPAAVADKPKGKPGPKPKEKPVESEPAEDPLAGLNGGDNGSEQEQGEDGSEDDPLAGLMAEDPPAPPPITKPDLAKILQEFVTLVEKVKGKGKGADALVGLFKKHGASDLKSLKEEEFLGVKNEASAVIQKIKEMTA